MSNIKKLMMSAAGGDSLDVDDVFSTYLYTGNGTSQTITNGLDLAGEGGLIWNKYRSGSGHHLFDTARGIDYNISTHSAEQQYDYGGDVTSVNSDGFSLGYYSGGVNYSGRDYATWSFRKAPKFFDVVTYTGAGALQSISHNLGSVPGCIIIKCTSTGSTNWMVYHRGEGANRFGYLNETNAFITNTGVWQNTTPTASQFYLGFGDAINGSGKTYVAYLFAHNDGDGEFGPDGDQDIIKCGSYTGNFGTQSINLGFEPQFLLIKNTTNSGTNWELRDTMRGFNLGDGGMELEANQSTGENTGGGIIVVPDSTGFSFLDWTTDTNYGSSNYIYMAIRRGPLAAPESATDVFDVAYQTGTAGLPTYKTDFVTDFAIRTQGAVTNAQSKRAYSRLQGAKRMQTNENYGEGGESAAEFDFMNGFGGFVSSITNAYCWMWKRAPSFFDVVAFTAGTSANRRLNHNLGVAPEMVWVKRRDGSRNWYVYNKDLGDASYGARDYRLYVNSSQGKVGPAYDMWGTSDPTSTDFGLNENDVVGVNGSKCIAYLFASAPGVSKVGSYTGNGTSGRVIDCGFSSGARFILIKGVDIGTDWYVWDAERGIVSGNDGYLLLNTNSSENTNTDTVDPNSSGFSISDSIAVNGSGYNYIFYAIA